MICPPCANAADATAKAVRDGEIQPEGHYPEICRDYAIQPGGCGCQHKPAGAIDMTPTGVAGAREGRQTFAR